MRVDWVWLSLRARILDYRSANGTSNQTLWPYVATSGYVNRSVSKDVNRNLTFTLCCVSEIRAHWNVKAKHALFVISAADQNILIGVDADLIVSLLLLSSLLLIPIPFSYSTISVSKSNKRGSSVSSHRGTCDRVLRWWFLSFSSCFSLLWHPSHITKRQNAEDI